MKKSQSSSSTMADFSQRFISFQRNMSSYLDSGNRLWTVNIRRELRSLIESLESLDAWTMWGTKAGLVIILKAIHSSIWSEWECLIGSPMTQALPPISMDWLRLAWENILLPSLGAIIIYLDNRNTWATPLPQWMLGAHIQERPPISWQADSFRLMPPSWCFWDRIILSTRILSSAILKLWPSVPAHWVCISIVEYLLKTDTLIQPQYQVLLTTLLSLYSSDQKNIDLFACIDHVRLILVGLAKQDQWLRATSWINIEAQRAWLKQQWNQYVQQKSPWAAIPVASYQGPQSA